MEEAIRMLASENHLVRLDGLTRLRREGAEEVTEYIVSAMRDAHRAVRTVAYAVAAFYPDDPDIRSALQAAVAGPPSTDRMLAISSLAQMGDASMLPLAVETLRGEDHLYHLAAFSALCDLGGSEAMAIVGEHATRCMPAYWHLLVGIIAAVGPHGCDVLSSLASNAAAPELMRALALKALSEADVERALSTAARCVDAPAPILRAAVRVTLLDSVAEAAPHVLEGLVDPARRDGLTRVLDYGAREASAEFAEAMGAIRDAEARLAIAEALLAVRDPAFEIAEALARWCSPRNPVAVRVAAIRAHCWMAVTPRQGVALLASCLRDSDPEVVRVAHEYAPGSVLTVRTGDEAKVARDLARDRDPTRRRLGARWLPATGTESIPHLTHLLRDPDPRVRNQAALSLGALGEYAARAVPALIEALDEPPSTIPSPAQLALQDIGGPAAEALIGRTLRGGPGSLQAACALHALGYRHALEDAPTPRVFQRLCDGDETLRVRAAEVLASRKGVAVDEALASALADPSGRVRATAARSLGKRGSVRATRILASVLGRCPDPAGADREVVRALLDIGERAAPAVLEALARGQAVPDVADLATGDPEVWAPLLIAELGRDHPDERLAHVLECLGMLESIPGEAAAPCATIARSGRGASVRMRAAEVLEGAESDPDRVHALYRDLAKDTDPYVRLEALHWLDAPELAEAGQAAAASGPTSVRASGLRALWTEGRIEGHEEMVREALATPGTAEDWTALVQVARALGGSDMLVAAAEDRWLDHSDAAVRRLVAASLDQLGVDALAALRKALADPDPQVFVEAARGLRNLGRGEETVAPLIERLGDTGPARLAAIGELAWVGPPALDALRPLLARDDAATIVGVAAVVREMARIDVVEASSSVLLSLEAGDREVRLQALRQCQERW